MSEFAPNLPPSQSRSPIAVLRQAIIVIDGTLFLNAFGSTFLHLLPITRGIRSKVHHPTESAWFLHRQFHFAARNMRHFSCRALKLSLLVSFTAIATGVLATEKGQHPHSVQEHEYGIEGAQHQGNLESWNASVLAHYKNGTDSIYHLHGDSNSTSRANGSTVDYEGNSCRNLIESSCVLTIL